MAQCENHKLIRNRVHTFRFDEYDVRQKSDRRAGQGPFLIDHFHHHFDCDVNYPTLVNVEKAMLALFFLFYKI